MEQATYFYQQTGSNPRLYSYLALGSMRAIKKTIDSMNTINFYN